MIFYDSKTLNCYDPTRNTSHNVSSGYAVILKCLFKVSVCDWNSKKLFVISKKNPPKNLFFESRIVLEEKHVIFPKLNKTACIRAKPEYFLMPFEISAVLLYSKYQQIQEKESVHFFVFVDMPFPIQILSFTNSIILFLFSNWLNN